MKRLLLALALLFVVCAATPADARIFRRANRTNDSYRPFYRAQQSYYHHGPNVHNSYAHYYQTRNPYSRGYRPYRGGSNYVPRSPGVYGLYTP